MYYHLKHDNIVGGKGIHMFYGLEMELDPSSLIKLGEKVLMNKYSQILVRGGLLN